MVEARASNGSTAVGFLVGFFVASLIALLAWGLVRIGGARMPWIDASRPAVVNQIRGLQRLETVIFGMDKIVTGERESPYLPKFLAGDRDVQRYYFQEGGNLPTVANGVELMPELAVLPDAEIIATEPSFTEPRYPWAASDPRWSLQAALQAAIAGTLTPEEALAQAQAETDAWLASQ